MEHIVSRLRDLSLKTKLALIVLATTGASLLAIVAVLAVGEFLRYREDTVAVLDSHAQITAINAAAALAFRDVASTTQTLSALHAAPGIQGARIYDADGRLFASFQREAADIRVDPWAAALTAPKVSLTRVTIDRPIEFSNAAIGFLRIDADFSGYLDSLRRFGLALLIAAAGALAAALCLLIPLRDAVARPIETLAGLVTRVRREHDYSLRATVSGRDELGSLAESFNAMLEEIEGRDKRLAREHDLVSTILDTTDAAILVVGAGSIVVQANGAFLRAAARPAQACIGRPIWEAAGVEDQAAFCVALDRGSEFEATLHPAQGEPRCFAWRSSRTSAGDGDSELTVVTGIDITEHKRVEATLRHAKEAAEAANVAKSRFVANMSHEIRTPMNGVLGMAYVMQSSCVDEAQRHSLETIIASGEALLRILNDILDFSKIEAGRLEIVRAPFPLHDHIEDVVQVFAAEARAKLLSLRLSFDPAVPTIAVGDSLRVRQVLSNLIGNAIKFTHTGEVTVHVQPQSRAVAGIADTFDLRISVADTGVGVSIEAQERIFEAFTQADSTTQREHGGTGLGLSISRELVTMMGGQLEMSSRPSGGSIFSFTVPLGHTQPAPTSLTPLGIRVLLVDGDLAHRDFEVRRMASWGVGVDVAATRLEALERLAGAQSGPAYDALVLDDGLPGGWQRLLIDMQSVPNASAIPVALFGSGATPASEGEFQRLVAVELAKPVKSSALYNFLLARSNRTALRARSTDERIEASVLLVEDNPVNVEVGSAMLKQAGCRVTVAMNGRDALGAMARGRFDIVLMDCQLPGLDGYAVTRIIRQREAAEGGHQRIVAVTAHALAGDRAACLEAGMDDYMSKPFSPVQMRAMLVSNLGLEAPAPTAAAPGQDADDPPRDDAPPQDPVHCAAAFGELLDVEQGGSPGIVRRLMGHFEEQAKSAGLSLEAAIRGVDIAVAADAMHSFRSTAAHLGGLRLARLCQDIERVCVGASSTPLKAAAERFDMEVTDLRRALAKVVPAMAAAAPAPAAPAERARLLALIVDDGVDDRTLLGIALRRNGFDVVEAADAAEGLRVANAQQPDVVLLDRRLNNVDGILLVPDFIRAGKAGPLPVIIVTGMVYPAIAEQARVAGALGMIEKSKWSEIPRAVGALLATLQAAA